MEFDDDNCIMVMAYLHKFRQLCYNYYNNRCYMLLNNQTIECFPFKKCIFSAHLRYVQLFSNSITILLIFIQRRYMRTTLSINMAYLSRSDVFTTPRYIFLRNNYHCSPHISLLPQTYEEMVKKR